MSNSFMAIAQARLTSRRFPRKIFANIGSKMLIEHVNDYCSKNFKNNYIFAIPQTKNNDELFNFLNNKDLPVYRGEEDNVLKRYRDIIEKYEPEFFIRVTADNPYKCPNIIDKMLNIFLGGKMKLLTNSVLKTFPLGLEIEIIDSEYFLYNTKNFKNVDYLEHVTLGLYHNFKKDVKHFMATSDNSDIRFTIDYEDDLKFISKINQNLLYEKIT